MADQCLVRTFHDVEQLETIPVIHVNHDGGDLYDILLLILLLLLLLYQRYIPGNMETKGKYTSAVQGLCPDHAHR